MRVFVLLALLLSAVDGGSASPLPPGAVELLPKGAAPADRLPLVVAIHGRGGNPLRFAQFVQSSAPNVRIVALQAPTPLSEGFSWFDHRLRGDAGEDDNQVLARALASRAEQIRPQISAIAAARPHCGDPIIVGYSQGGALALALAVSSPPDFKARYFEIAGALPPSFPFGEHLADMTGFHGTADQSVPYELAVETFKRAPSSVTWTLFAYEGAAHDPPRELRQDLGNELRQAFQRACQ